jgi:hypothetical protein
VLSIYDLPSPTASFETADGDSRGVNAGVARAIAVGPRAAMADAPLAAFKKLRWPMVRIPSLKPMAHSPHHRRNQPLIDCLPQAPTG